MSTMQQEPVPAPVTDEVRPMDTLPPVDPVAPTGPIDGLAGLPQAAAPPPPPGRRFSSRGGAVRVRLQGARRPHVRLPAGVAGPAAGVLAVVLLELGLLLHEGGRTLWSRTPLWSAFATLATVVGLVALAAPLPGLRGPGRARAWAVAAGGLCGLAVFWLLVALPAAATDRGFLLTAALASLGAAVWTTATRETVTGETATDELR